LLFEGSVRIHKSPAAIASQRGFCFRVHSSRRETRRAAGRDANPTLLLARVRSAGTRVLTCAAASLLPDARRMRPGRRRRHRCCGICARVAHKTWHRRRSCAIRNCP
jgi:hypothetical protein